MRKMRFLIGHTQNDPKAQKCNQIAFGLVCTAALVENQFHLGRLLVSLPKLLDYFKTYKA